MSNEHNGMFFKQYASHVTIIRPLVKEDEMDNEIQILLCSIFKIDQQTIYAVDNMRFR